MILTTAPCAPSTGKALYQPISSSDQAVQSTASPFRAAKVREAPGRDQRRHRRWPPPPLLPPPRLPPPLPLLPICPPDPVTKPLPFLL